MGAARPPGAGRLPMSLLGGYALRGGFQPVVVDGLELRAWKSLTAFCCDMESSSEDVSKGNYATTL